MNTWGFEMSAESASDCLCNRMLGISRCVILDVIVHAFLDLMLTLIDLNIY